MSLDSGSDWVGLLRECVIFTFNGQVNQSSLLHLYAAQNSCTHLSGIGHPVLVNAKVVRVYQKLETKC